MYIFCIIFSIFLYKHLYLLVLWSSNLIFSKYRRRNWDVESLNILAQGYKANEWLSSKDLNEVNKTRSLLFYYKSKIMSPSSQLQILWEIGSNINTPASILQYKFKVIFLGKNKGCIKKNTHTHTIYTTLNRNY